MPAMLDEAARLAVLEREPRHLVVLPSDQPVPPRAKFPERLRRTAPARHLSRGRLLPDSMRKVIEDVMGQPVFSSTAPAGSAHGLGVPREAGHHHIDADSVIFRVVDDDGPPVRPGETGRVIATGLINRMMPLVRYELGDLVVASDRRCACGRALPADRAHEGRLKRRVRAARRRQTHAWEMLE
ncbi:MAG: hypothetical protein IPM35_20295, partial [Myxococcales bacterium]|nr:hypothetical protein [Myxococcales bacterium]